MARLRGLNQSRATRCCATCCPWCGGEDKIHSHSFRASWCAPAGPLHNMKETAPWRCAFVFIVFALLASELTVMAKTIKTASTIVETVSFTLCGEDKNIFSIPSLFRWSNHQPFAFGILRITVYNPSMILTSPTAASIGQSCPRGAQFFCPFPR